MSQSLCVCVRLYFCPCPRGSDGGGGGVCERWWWEGRATKVEGRDGETAVVVEGGGHQNGDVVRDSRLASEWTATKSKGDGSWI